MFSRLSALLHKRFDFIKSFSREGRSRRSECETHKNGRAVKFPARPQSFVFLLEVYLSLGGLGGGY